MHPPATHLPVPFSCVATRNPSPSLRKLMIMSCKKPNCKCKGDPKWAVAAPTFDNCFFQYIAKNARPHTLQEIANLLGITVFSVTTVEKKALKKLHKYFLKKSVTESGML